MEKIALSLILYFVLGNMYLFSGTQEIHIDLEHDWSKLQRIGFAAAEILVGVGSVCISLFLFLFWKTIPPALLWYLVVFAGLLHYGFGFWVMDREITRGLFVQHRNFGVKIFICNCCMYPIGAFMITSLIELCKIWRYPFEYLVNDRWRLIFFILLWIVGVAFPTRFISAALQKKIMMVRQKNEAMANVSE